MCVPDRPADIRQALESAAQRTDLIIVTGGLGPTDNDLTRAVLSEFTGIALKEPAEALNEMAQRFQVAPADLRANLRRQIQAPIRGTHFKNKNGTAVGLVFEKGQQVIIALPGPPRELQPMVNDALVPYLSRRFGTRLPGCALTLRFVGLGQSRIDQVLSDHIQMPPNVTLSSQFQGGRVDFTFSLPTDTAPDRARLDDLKKAIMQHLGPHIYADSDTSLEEGVMQSLRAQGVTLALIEVGSGGDLTAALMRTPEVSEVLRGSYVAPTTERLRALLNVQDGPWRELSPNQKIEYLAQAAARATGSHWTLAIGPPHPKENTGRHVGVVFRRAQGQTKHQRLPLYGRGETACARLTTQLLDLLRRQLKQPPARDALSSNATH